MATTFTPVMRVHDLQYRLTGRSGRVVGAARAPTGTAVPSACTPPGPDVVKVLCDSLAGFDLTAQANPFADIGPTWTARLGFNAQGIIGRAFFVGAAALRPAWSSSRPSTPGP